MRVERLPTFISIQNSALGIQGSSLSKTKEGYSLMSSRASLASLVVEVLIPELRLSMYADRSDPRH
jgi:hypothetical protein